MRRFLSASLAGQGFRIVEATTGKSALSLLEIEKPDIIILDLGLPDIDGFEVIRRVRRTSRVPIIVLSVRDDEPGKVQALELGADDFVTKPFGMAELLARLKTALRHRLQ